MALTYQKIKSYLQDRAKEREEKHLISLIKKHGIVLADGLTKSSRTCNGKEHVVLAECRLYGDSEAASQYTDSVPGNVYWWYRDGTLLQVFKIGFRGTILGHVIFRNFCFTPFFPTIDANTPEEEIDRACPKV